MDAAGHPALLAVDCIACLGCDEFRMDDWGVDVMVAACQKGLMTPPGMAFVWFTDKAAGRARVANCARPTGTGGRGPKPEGFWQYLDGTAPTHHLYGLREALDMIHEEGLRRSGSGTSRWPAPSGRRSTPGGRGADRAERARGGQARPLGDGGADRRAACDGAADWSEEQAGVTLGIGLGMETARTRSRRVLAGGAYGPCERPHDAGRAGDDGGGDDGDWRPPRARAPWRPRQG